MIEKIQEAAADGRTVFSFEYFPPKTEEGLDNLFERMDRMVAHGPNFCDITWGAGGSTADLTLEIANRMQNMVRLCVCVCVCLCGVAASRSLILSRGAVRSDLFFFGRDLVRRGGTDRRKWLCLCWVGCFWIMGLDN